MIYGLDAAKTLKPGEFIVEMTLMEEARQLRSSDIEQILDEAFTFMPSPRRVYMATWRGIDGQLRQSANVNLEDFRKLMKTECKRMETP